MYWKDESISLLFKEGYGEASWAWGSGHERKITCVSQDWRQSRFAATHLNFTVNCAHMERLEAPVEKSRPRNDRSDMLQPGQLASRNRHPTQTNTHTITRRRWEVILFTLAFSSETKDAARKANDSDVSSCAGKMKDKHGPWFLDGKQAGNRDFHDVIATNQPWMDGSYMYFEVLKIVFLL